MTKFQRSIAVSLCTVMIFSLLFADKNDRVVEKQLMFFPSLSFGCSVEKNNDKNAKVIEKDTDVEYSFRILEIISKWFS